MGACIYRRNHDVYLENKSLMDDHKLDLGELYQRYGTDSEIGLTDSKAREILDRDGPNILSPPKGIPVAMKFARHMFNGFACLFWICAILCFIGHGLTIVTHHQDTSNIYLWIGIVLIVLVVINSCFSYYQKVKSSRIMNSMKTKSMMSQQVLVIRDGEKKKMKSEDLVIGDIIEINAGDCISADIRIIESNCFKVDNSSLTGESEPQSRSTEFTNENYLETKNLAFSGTLAVEGTAKGLVMHTGDRTLIGCLHTLTWKPSTNSYMLTVKEIYRSIYIITGVAVFFGISFFIATLSLGYSFIEAAILLVVIIIINVPKGLFITIEICLRLIAERMVRKNCWIKNLKIVETLGSTSIIFADKTGTLTRNQLVVAHLWFDNRRVEMDFNDDQHAVAYDKRSNAFVALTRCVMLCSRADFKQDSENLARLIAFRACNGNASEAALFRFVEASVSNVCEFREAHRRVCEIPFYPRNKYQLSIHGVPTTNESEDDVGPYLLVMKGAPEQIIHRCSTICIDGTDIEMNDYWRNLALRSYSELGNIGERVLGFCDLRLWKNEYPFGYSFDADEVNFPTKNLRFLGLISLIDPPRAGVRETILKLRSAGMKVIMVTGDHQFTAKSIARAVDIISEGTETVEDIAQRLDIPREEISLDDAQACVINGHNLAEMSSEEINKLLRDHTEIVFAKVSPQQKATIIESCQQDGAIVTMIGDSINDLPALKQANVRVVMGIAGSDATKDVADIILLDDNFASIAIAVEQGRLMSDNLKKSIAYTMTSNMAKMSSILICLLMGIPLGRGIITVLCIDLVNTIGAISLAYEKAETDIMRRRPRDQQYNRFLSNRRLLMTYVGIGMSQVTVGLTTYFMIMAESGFLLSRLSDLRKSWKSEDANNLQNFYDQQRKQLDFSCYTAFVVATIICQWATLIIYKTRRDSIVQQGIKNLMFNFGTLFQITSIAVISYVLYSNMPLEAYSFKFRWCLPILSYIFLLLICDEIRKYFIRKHSGGSLESKTKNYVL